MSTNTISNTISNTTDKLQLILKNSYISYNNESKYKQSNYNQHVFTDNLAFTYNDYIVKTSLAIDGESYSYIPTDYSCFDYLNDNENETNKEEIIYIEDLESDEEFSKRWNEDEDRSISPASISSESEDDGDWYKY